MSTPLLSSMELNEADYDYDQVDGGGVGEAEFILPLDAHVDDEHKLIARYAAKLAGRTEYRGGARLSQQTAQFNDELAQQQLIAQLEQRNKWDINLTLQKINREILREIQQIAAMQQAHQAQMANLGQYSEVDESGLTIELDTLRQRKLELEQRMRALQDGRHDLVLQLEHLMKVLKVG